VTAKRGNGRIKVSDGNGGHKWVRPLGHAVLCGECPNCGECIWVRSNLGLMLCSHCGKPIPEWCWGRLEPVFVPEDPAK